jgi:hypothetical protein
VRDVEEISALHMVNEVRFPGEKKIENERYHFFLEKINMYKKRK